MKPNPKLSCAIMAVLSASAAPVYAAPAETPTSASEIGEVVVTAQRRTESIQNVPITVQALTGETLTQLNVATLDDYVKYVPNVTMSNLGPGQGNVYMRGLGVGQLGTQGSGSIGNFPNVAIYLDDQSVMLPSRNLDIYAADLERIEVLEGPQGTLFGAGAQAGVVRYITNKPKVNTTEANVSAGYSATAHGDPSSNVEGVLNVPLIDDKFAMRGVFYTESRGGYIDNVGSTFTRQNSDIAFAGHASNIGAQPGCPASGCIVGIQVPNNAPVVNNYNLTSRSINPLTYQGLRLSALYKFSDSWDALVTQSWQTMHAQGVFYEMPKSVEGQALADRSVTTFAPSHNNDRFSNTALTITGQVGPLRAVYAGAYLVRNVEQIQDYSSYARGYYGAYYQCAGLAAGTYDKATGTYTPPDPTKGQCYSPVSTWHDTERNTHLSNELRFSTPDDWRVRGIFGLFYEDYHIYDDTEWKYRSVPNCSPSLPTNCFLPIGPVAGAQQNNLSLRDEQTAFFDDFQRTIKQTAFFASADFDIIPKVLTITGGTRYFDIRNEIVGANSFSFGCKVPGYNFPTGSTGGYYGVCPNADSTNIGLQNPHTNTATGFRSRGNLTWHVTPDFLAYYTFSQGFRPGGFNRGSSNVLPDANGVYQYAKPYNYVSDDLTNNEIGWKTEWFNHRLQFNGAIYREDWKNVQVGFFCPSCGLGNLTFGTNGPDYRVKGVEIQLVSRVTEGLTVQGSASWNSSSQTNSPFLINNNPASPNHGQSITSWCDPSTTPCTPKELKNVFGAIGSPLAFSPPFQGNLRARYEWAMGSYNAFVQAGVVHQAHSFTATGNNHAFELPDWTTYDAALGVSKDAWVVQLYGQNITDVNKSLFTTDTQQVITETPMRPRVLGITATYRFAGR